MNIIFLDVDGVLTYSEYNNIETADIDIDKVKLLKEICDKSNAKVVISSSWKGSEKHTPKIYYILLDILKGNGIEVIGTTPYICARFKKEEMMQPFMSIGDLMDFKVEYGTGRVAEIRQWLTDHKIDNFVILDDENWNWADYGYEKNWLQSTWFGNGGLKREHVDKAVNILTSNAKSL